MRNVRRSSPFAGALSTPRRGVTSPRDEPKKKVLRYWTEEERLRLEQLAASGMGIGRAAREIDRDLGATWRKARSWGIKFRGQRT
jgi:hypothetical protein